MHVEPPMLLAGEEGRSTGHSRIFDRWRPLAVFAVSQAIHQGLGRNWARAMKGNKRLLRGPRQYGTAMTPMLPYTPFEETA
jgi:hypothetical protein